MKKVKSSNSTLLKFSYLVSVFKVAYGLKNVFSFYYFLIFKKTFSIFYFFRFLKIFLIKKRRNRF